MKRALPLSAFVVIAIAVLSTLAGCAQSEPANTDRAATGEAPPFSGPYANEYRQAWIDSEDEFVHQVLADEEITDQEWAEIGTRLGECLDGQGISFLGFEPDGAYSIDPGQTEGDRANEVMGDCEQESGEAWVNALRSMPLINPENRDMNEIMAECLVRVGAVAPGYAADDYTRDASTFGFAFLDPDKGPDLLWACNADPLSILEGQ